MHKYLAWRVAALLPTLLLVSALAFALTQLAGGDPARLAAEQGGDLASDDVTQTLRERWGLNDALPTRYVKWLGQVAQGNLGTSFLSGRPVVKELREKYPATLLLAITAMLFAVAAGIPLGVVTALKNDSWLDHLARLSAVSVAAVPGFWLGLLLIVLFGERLGWLPTGGFGMDSHVILPALALGSLPCVTVMRLTRSSVLETRDLDYVRTAYAKGLSVPAVSWRHILPNALIPSITYLGLHFGHLLGGAVVIEAIFAWPGVGQIVLQAVSGRDLPVIAGYVLVSALIYVAVNLLVDVSYAILDPRVRLR